MSLSKIFSKDEYNELKACALPVHCPKVSASALSEKGAVVFGAGLHGKMLTESMVRAGYAPAWIVDGNPHLNGKSLNGVPIRSKESLADVDGRYIILAGQYAASMAKDCEDFGIKSWILPAALSGFLYTPGELGISFDEMEELREIEECFALLQDDESRNVFKDFIRFQCTFDLGLFKHYDPDIYFSKTLQNKIDYSIFVDGGAFDGDTLKSWLGHVAHGHYYGFEPQLSAYDKLCRLADKDPYRDISIYNLGLAQKECYMHLELDGVASTFMVNSANDSQKPSVKIVRLDQVVKEPPTLIKADVEGFELAMLEGASGCINEKTSFIVSVYHKKYDFFSLPLLLHEISPKNKLYMRQHMPVYGDTMVYSIAEN